MKALVQHTYGSLNTALRVEETALAEPGPGEVRVRIFFAALNPLDWKIVSGQYKWVVKARPPCGVGFEFSGQVEHNGARAARFAPGARVAALLPAATTRPCAIAQSANVKEDLLVAVPAEVPHEQAAAVPIAGLSAMQLLKLIGVTRGQRILINGAAGGVGHLAVQLASRAGARVTGTARVFNHESVQSLGPERVIDPRSSEPAGWGGPFDAIIDCASTLSRADVKALMPNGGRYASTLPQFPGVILDPLRNRVSSNKRFALMLKPTTRDLESLMQSLKSRELRVLVSRVFALDAAIDALTRLREGGVAGKILVDTAR